MSDKILWTGLTCIVALPHILPIPAIEIVGAIFMLIGIVLKWLDK